MFPPWVNRIVTVPEDGSLQVMVTVPPADTSQPVVGLLITFCCANATAANTEAIITLRNRIVD